MLEKRLADFLRIHDVRRDLVLPFSEFMLTVLDAFLVTQVASDHQYIRSQVANQHFCAGRIVETDIFVHVIDQIQ